MERSYEEIYAIAEDQHPWFVARRELFATFAGPDPSTRILDVGCGTGIFLAYLRALGFGNLAGVETSMNLRAKSRDKTIEIFNAVPRGRYEKIFMLDVLEHIEDDRRQLTDVLGLLEPGGTLHLSVPAHPFLWSHHDDLNQHKRRYTKKDLVEKLLTAGFELRRLSYWNMASFPAVYFSRLLGLGNDSSDLDLGGPIALRLYGAILRLENRLLRRFRLPIGVSLIAVARKPAGHELAPPERSDHSGRLVGSSPAERSSGTFEIDHAQKRNSDKGD